MGRHNRKTSTIYIVNLQINNLHKLMGVIVTLVHRNKRFGGSFKLILGSIIETVFAIIVAPLMMVFHAYLLNFHFCSIRYPNITAAGISFISCLAASIKGVLFSISFACNISLKSSGIRYYSIISIYLYIK